MSGNQKFGSLFSNPQEEVMANVLIQLVAEVAGYAVSEAVIQHQQGKPIRAAVEHGVVEFGTQLIARLKQLGDIEA